MASVNFQKCKAGTGGAVPLMRHCDKEERLRHNHSNEHIDKKITPSNSQWGTYRDALRRFRDRINTLDSTTNTNKRKDRVECFALETAVPKELQKYPDDFAAIMWDAVAEQYGEQNIVSWYVHRDEVHDYLDHGKVKKSLVHVHMFVVPEREGKLNGKWFSSKANMQKLNKTIDERLGKEYGVAYMTGDEPRHKSVEELKIESFQEAEEALEETRAKLATAQEQLLEAKGDVSDLRSEKNALNAEKNALNGDINALQEKKSDVIEEIKTAQKQFSEVKGVVSDLRSEKNALNAEKNALNGDIDALQEKKGDLIDKIERLKTEKTKLKTDIGSLTAKLGSLERIRNAFVKYKDKLLQGAKKVLSTTFKQFREDVERGGAIKVEGDDVELIGMKNGNGITVNEYVPLINREYVRWEDNVPIYQRVGEGYRPYKVWDRGKGYVYDTNRWFTAFTKDKRTLCEAELRSIKPAPLPMSEQAKVEELSEAIAEIDELLEEYSPKP